MGQCKIATSKGEICRRLKIGKKVFNALVDEGMPVKKRGNRWFGHMDEIEEWFRIKPEKKERLV
jgi:hypothetical protein